MSRKTRIPTNTEELLDLPRHSQRWVPVPGRLKISVCHLCGNWTVRRGGNSITDERSIRGHIRQGSIRFRACQSLGDRPLCEYCHQAENEMDQDETRLEIVQDEIVQNEIAQDEIVGEVAHVA